MSKKHHYVPMSLLKNFSVANKGKQVCVFDKKKCSSYATAVRDAGSENHFNTLVVEDGSHVNFEGAFQRVDDRLAAVVRKIQRTRALAALSAQDRVDIAHMIPVLLLRVQMQRNFYPEMNEQLRAFIERVGGDASEEAIPRITENDARRLSLQQLADSHKFVPLLLDKDWILSTTTDELPFWISDNPVVMVNAYPYGDVGMSAQGIEVCLPISSTILLSLACTTIANKQGDPGFAEFLRSEPTMKLREDGVGRYNGLQVSRSTRFIYGNDRRFEQARRILREHPEVGDPRSAPGMSSVPVKPGMPDGLWLVAYGVRTHHMLRLERWVNADGGISAQVDAEHSDELRTMLDDGPFSLIEIYRERRAGRGMRDVSIKEVSEREIRIEHTDESRRRLMQQIQRDEST